MKQHNMSQPQQSIFAQLGLLIKLHVHVHLLFVLFLPYLWNWNHDYDHDHDHTHVLHIHVNHNEVVFMFVVVVGAIHLEPSTTMKSSFIFKKFPMTSIHRSNTNRSIIHRQTALLHSNVKNEAGRCDFDGDKLVPSRWPIPKIESRGRYQDENFLERVIGGRLYEKQNDLPSLPVPELKNTADKLLDSALPLSESEEETKSFIAAVDKFEGEANELQQLLLQRHDEAKVNGTSWLSNWWNQLGYLKYREPVVINVSYFFHLNVSLCSYFLLPFLYFKSVYRSLHRFL